MRNEILNCSTIKRYALNSIFPNVSFFIGKSFNGNIMTSATEICMYLLEYANVAVVTGEAFGNSNCIRISYAASEKILIEAMSRIKNALEKLN
mgnify:CR=1 FL=1